MQNGLFVLMGVVVMWILAGIFGPDIEASLQIRAEGILKGIALLILAGYAVYQYLVRTDELREGVKPVTEVPAIFPSVDSAEFVARSTPMAGEPAITSQQFAAYAQTAAPNPQFPNVATPAISVAGTELFAPIVEAFPADTSSSLVIPGFDDCKDDQTFEIPWSNSSGMEFDSEIDLFDEEDANMMASYLDERMFVGAA